MTCKANRSLLCGLALGILGLMWATASKANAADIKGGIEGKIMKVDVDKGSVTITLPNGRVRTFSINEETVIVGPRGGTVRKRLKDHRFHEGLSITVVADGNTADELHLGYDRKARQRSEKSSSSTSGTSSTSRSNSETEATEGNSSSSSSTRTTRFRGNRQPTAGKDSREEEGDDEDDDFIGKVKSVEPDRHLLVITLLNGKDRAFLLARDVSVTVNGRASRNGLSDPAIKPGIPLTVVTESGGRKVKEVKVTPAVTRRLRRAG